MHTMILTKSIYLATMAAHQCKTFKTFAKNTRKILGAGVNYKGILKSGNIPSPEKPIIFLKPSTSVIEEGQDIIIPRGMKVNEEIELGIVIGTKCKNVSEDEAMNCVAGYCVALDLTATSELQPARKAGLPWTIGKGFDTACPVSRFISKEEIKDPHNVQLWVSINGEKKQEDNTSELIFPVPNLISFISKYMTLEPNDLILTGTPPGMSEIRPGDCIEGGIKNLVTIKFQVKSE